MLSSKKETFKQFIQTSLSEICLHTLGSILADFPPPGSGSALRIRKTAWKHTELCLFIALRIRICSFSRSGRGKMCKWQSFFTKKFENLCENTNKKISSHFFIHSKSAL
jgi:hypothetical protein